MSDCMSVLGLHKSPYVCMYVYVYISASTHIHEIYIYICYTGILNDPVPQDYTRDIPDI